MNQRCRRYTVVPDGSAVLINVTTTLGPIAFGTTGLQGFIEAAVADGELGLAAEPAAHLELQVSGLTSGNSAYDGELRRQIDVRRFPAAYVELHQIKPLGVTSASYQVSGEVTFRGLIQPVEGVLSVDLSEPGAMVVSGEDTLDIRMFEIPPPTLFMLKIEPHVKVSLHIEARMAGDV